jgi:hypothetical protein
LSIGIHVSTIVYVDTMILEFIWLRQMGWPDAYRYQSPLTLRHQQHKRLCICSHVQLVALAWALSKSQLPK